MYWQLWSMPFAKFIESPQMHYNTIHFTFSWPWIHYEDFICATFYVLLPSAEEIGCYSSFSNMMSTRLLIYLLLIAYSPVCSIAMFICRFQCMEWNGKMVIWIACIISIELCRNAWNVNYGPKIHNGNNNNWVIKMHLYAIRYVLDLI